MVVVPPTQSGVNAAVTVNELEGGESTVIVKGDPKLVPVQLASDNETIV
jgi:hypothetical protein